MLLLANIQPSSQLVVSYYVRSTTGRPWRRPPALWRACCSPGRVTLRMTVNYFQHLTATAARPNKRKQAEQEGRQIYKEERI